MVKHIQKFVGKLPANCLIVSGYFVGLAIKEFHFYVIFDIKDSINYKKIANEKMTNNNNDYNNNNNIISNN